MKSDKLRIALESLKGSVSSQTDAVELTGQTARASDGVYWAETTLPEPISGQIILPYSKLRSIVRTLGEEDEIEIEPNGPTCRVKASGTLWQLNLLNIPIEPQPESPVIKTIEAPGYTLLEAHKKLKHLIRADLSKQGLMWAWTNDNQELVIGDGSRLGGYHTAIKDLELTTMILSEIWRILGICMSETVTFTMGEKHIRATMRDSYFQATLPNGQRFETDWYNKVRNLLDEDPQVIKLSRSDLMRVIKQVGVTVGESTLKMTPGNGSIILATMDEHGNKSGSKVEAHGNLREAMTLNIDHLASAIEVLSDELMNLKVCKSAVEVSDTKGWEVIIRR